MPTVLFSAHHHGRFLLMTYSELQRSEVFCSRRSFLNLSWTEGPTLPNRTRAARRLNSVRLSVARVSHFTPVHPRGSLPGRMADRQAATKHLAGNRRQSEQRELLI
jgi:hypothetical protein